MEGISEFECMKFDNMLALAHWRIYIYKRRGGELFFSFSWAFNCVSGHQNFLDTSDRSLKCKLCADSDPLEGWLKWEILVSSLFQ